MARNNTYVYFRTISTLFLLLISYTLCAFCKDNDTEYLDADFTVTQPDGTCTYYFGTGYIKQDGPQYAVSPSQTPVQSPLQYYYYTKDHLGNIRSVVTKNPSTNAVTEVQRTHYYPYGGIIADISMGRNVQPRLYNGKELDRTNNLWWYDFGARQYDAPRGQFTNPDRFREKYYALNPYSFSANNPINIIDINGDSLWISYKGNSYLYQDGSLFNKDGSVYEGKIRGFINNVLDAFGKISKSQEGKALIYELQSSSNCFTIIKDGKSSFSPFNKGKAYAKQLSTDPFYHNSYESLSKNTISITGGSGGIISWDTTGTILPTTHGGVRNSILDLSHEMSHAADSNKGLLDSRIENGIKRSEWQAVYHENIIRSQLGIPLRTYYKVRFTSSGDFLGGDGPYLLDSANNPIKPHWY